MTEPAERTYSPIARAFHWATVSILLLTFPIGVAMHDRGTNWNIWDAVTNTMYSTHKFLGFVLLLLVVARLVYRLVHGTPPPEPSLKPLQRMVAEAIHWAIYVLLISVAMLGWIGVQLFPSLLLFDLFALPAFLSPDNALSKQIFVIHAYLAYVLLGLVGLHVAAALYHYFIRKDGVLSSMWPGLRSR